MWAQGYSLSAQTPYALDNLRWIGNYVMKLHYSDVEFCAQVHWTTCAHPRSCLCQSCYNLVCSLPSSRGAACACTQRPGDLNVANMFAAYSICIWQTANGRHSFLSSAVPAGEPTDVVRGAADAARPCSQVGDVNADHSAWGRAEDMTMPRPSYSVDPNNPGAPWAGADSPMLPVAPCAPPARTHFPDSTFCTLELFVRLRQEWLVKP